MKQSHAIICAFVVGVAVLAGLMVLQPTDSDAQTYAEARASGGFVVVPQSVVVPYSPQVVAEPVYDPVYVKALAKAIAEELRKTPEHTTEDPNASDPAPTPPVTPPPAAEMHRGEKLVRSVCAKCHQVGAEKLDPTRMPIMLGRDGTLNPSLKAGDWSKIAKAVHEGRMPPSPEPPVSDDDYLALKSWIEQRVGITLGQ